MSTIVRLSSEHTITLPEELIKKMHFSTYDEILVHVKEDKLILSKKTGNYTDKLRGLHKEVWENVDSEEFLKKERQSWEKHAEN
ncbi:MAG: AbrB/MazE/SpoVT family DNA-binding domain-containing protein [Methanolobus sp.]|nr:AbrB/MazE/SpoVT family DNA-binding domain-containing protein [Methanolobus sp.]